MAGAVSKWTVVIGHGGSPVGQGWGRVIDSASRVVRMWNCAWQDPVDYGRRYTHGIIEAHPKFIRNFQRFNQLQPWVGWVASYLDGWGRRAGHPYRVPPKCETHDQRLWIEDPQLGGKVGGVGETGRWELTRGGFAGMWAIMTSRPGDQVTMVGCDNLRGGIALPVAEGFPLAYRRDPATESFQDYVVGALKTGNHDFPAERRLLQLYARQRHIDLAWWDAGQVELWDQRRIIA